MAEKSVHTLKGTAGNLSLMKLFQAADDTVQAIRTAQDREEIQKLADSVGEIYRETCDAIRKSVGD